MIIINNRKICNSYEPYIIAELSANHCGSLEKALKTIKSAKESGADAIKIQSYTADSMTIDCKKEDFLIKEGTWKGYQLYDLYKEAATPYSWHKEIFKYAQKIGITIFSTPFDESAVDLLENLDTPAYKIASFEIVDLPLIKYIALKGKPILVHHKSFSYLVEWLEINQIGSLEPRPGMPPTTSHLNGLLKTIESNPVDLIIRTPYDPRKASDWLTEKTNIPNVILPYTTDEEDVDNLFKLFDRTIFILKQ